MSDNKIILPFSDLKQNSLLGHLLLNESFFKMAYTRIKPEWFLSARNGQIFKLLLSYYEKYKLFPSIPEFKSYKEFTVLEPKEREIYFAFISRAVGDTQQIRLEAIKPDLTEWLHTIILMKGMTRAADEYQKQNIKATFNILSESIREVSTSTFDKGNAVDFLNFNEYLQEDESERADALTTGLSILDKCLLKDATSGGLQRGDATVIMAPVNIGKTSTMISIICHNIKAGKDALFFTHEGRHRDIRLKILSHMLNCSIGEIFNLYKTEQGTQRVINATKLIDRHLVYIPYNRAGMTIEEVVPIIRMNQEDWMANHNGKGFDLLVSDYPAKLTTELAKRGTLQKRSVDEVIYDNYVQLALEYNFHSLTAIQTNREGSKVNKGLMSERRLLQAEDVQESFGPIQGATNIITLNRSPEAMKRGLITFNIAKSRGSETGVAVIAKSNFANNTTHSEELGGMAYTGTKLMDDFYDKFIESYRNQKIPSHITLQMGL